MTMTEKKIGKITHYYNHLHVATVNITDGELQIGDMIHVEGHTSNFMQKLCSMELEHESTDVAKPGDNVGIAIDEYARENDSVYVVH
jgi:translation elongation factor EF-1alpha